MPASTQILELLAPAKTIDIGVAAINNGADAVYIGAPSFGARRAAANSVQDIATLTEYAHKFNCRVFVALNTILYEEELREAEKIIRELYSVGVDALIVQDMAVLRMDIPPICLHASTQTHNWDIDRIKFLDRVGFSRIVLAREMSIESIKAIRKEIDAEIEVFVHGALCVSFSGQCYMSQYMYGRSANRGDCAQPCRQRWSLRDRAGKILAKDKFLLSLRDMNRSKWIKELADAGVNSFKIEGRLKEIDYVSNVTQYYSEIINTLPNVRRVGIGQSVCNFTPDPEKSFNRGFTDYFLFGRGGKMANIDTPKSMGKALCRVRSAKGTTLFLSDSNMAINNGDGLCYIDNGELVGVRVNSSDKNCLYLNSPISAKKGTQLYRNYDHLFVRLLEKGDSERKIGVSFSIYSEDNRLKVEAVDECGNVAILLSEEQYSEARDSSQAEKLCNRFTKCGDSEYRCIEVSYKSERVLFIPTAEANAIRRKVLSLLSKKREESYCRLKRRVLDNNSLPLPYPTNEANWQCNIANSEAENFYLEHNCSKIERGFEVESKRGKERAVMTTKYCILNELGMCIKKSGNKQQLKFPLHLYNNKFDFLLQLDCPTCTTKIIPTSQKIER